MRPPAPLLGLVCGAKAEAAALGALRRDPRVLWRASGARPETALAAAEALLFLGCRGLVSFGVAGGLAPGLAPGAVLSPDRVVDEAGARWPVDPLLTPRGGAAGALLSVARIVGDTAEKAALRLATEAAALDMESGPVAAAAAAAGVPFGAVRVVSDPAERAVPPALAAGLGPDGGARPGALLAAVLRAPGDLAGVARTIRDFGAARRALAVALEETLGPALAALEEEAG